MLCNCCFDLKDIVCFFFSHSKLSFFLPLFGELECMHLLFQQDCLFLCLPLNHQITSEGVELSFSPLRRCISWAQFSNVISIRKKGGIVNYKWLRDWIVSDGKKGETSDSWINLLAGGWWEDCLLGRMLPKTWLEKRTVTLCGLGHDILTQWWAEIMISPFREKEDW